MQGSGVRSNLSGIAQSDTFSARSDAHADNIHKYSDRSVSRYCLVLKE
jgi:hypothetical protein